MIAESRDNQMTDKWISVNSQKNHTYVILSLNSSHSVSNIDVKFTGNPGLRRNQFKNTELNEIILTHRYFMLTFQEK